MRTGDFTNQISCGKHFPERIYRWPDLDTYGAHCAICNTDYFISIMAESRTIIPTNSRLREGNIEVLLT